MSDGLRMETMSLARRLHSLIAAGKTPPPVYEKKCESCSMGDICMPKTGKTDVGKYLEKIMAPVDSF